MADCQTATTAAMMATMTVQSSAVRALRRSWPDAADSTAQGVLPGAGTSARQVGAGASASPTPARGNVAPG